MHTTISKIQIPFIVLWTLMAAAFITRVINLAYNSPFNDEAIYIVVGRFGIFQWDWTTYNAVSWMAGLPFIYPTLAALSYITGGVVGSRFLNVIFGVLTIELIFVITYFLSTGDKLQKTIAGLTASALVGGSAVSFYVSRLATYDMPSFYLLFLSLAMLLIAQTSEKDKQGKWYFFSAVSLFLSVATKIITGIYVPLVVGFAFVIEYKKSKTQFATFKKYYLFPLIFGFVFYILKFLPALRIFFSDQIFREYSEYSAVLSVFFENTSYVWLFWIVGLIGLVISKRFYMAIFLNVCAFWVLIFHLFTHRIPTLDKHTYLSFVFMAIIAGLGISYILVHFNKIKFFKKFFIGNLIGSLFIFWYLSYYDGQRFNSQWSNTNKALDYLAAQVGDQDKILTEIGAATILSVYDKDYPTNVTTFDWIEYKGVMGNEGYQQAVKEGYFKFIVLESQNKPKGEINKNIHKIIVDNFNNKYRLAYDDDQFLIYNRIPKI